MSKTLMLALLLATLAWATPAFAVERVHQLQGRTQTGAQEWQPTLLLREQPPASGDRSRPVLYVHGATFPSASSIMFKFDGVSWADELNLSGFSAWGLDFAGFGGSEGYPEMEAPTPQPGEPLGRAPAVAAQIERAVRFIAAQSGAQKVSIIAHSWGTMAAGLFASQHPELVERIVFFGPIVRRTAQPRSVKLGPWRFLTIEEQHTRFVEDVPSGHPPVLLDRHFEQWAPVYLASDKTSPTRNPPSVRTPNGPVADILAAWSGNLAYEPAKIKAPILIVRGEWDSLCNDQDVAWLLSGLTSSSQKRDVKIPKGTHLMHLEESRGQLYRAADDFLGSGKDSRSGGNTAGEKER
jgi:pimeloyl-ACP methyl ester carboxylesterase